MGAEALGSPTGNLRGWPFVNHATYQRRTSGANLTRDQVMIIPRTKFTYVIEFGPTPSAFEAPLTNIFSYVNDGTIYAPVQSIDRPKPNFAVETIRSYNKHIKVPTKMEPGLFSLSMHDDNASLAMGLYKEYENFYHHFTGIDRGVTAAYSPVDAVANHQSYTDLIGPGARQGQDLRPSNGMKLRPNADRHFFNYITIYDLGSDPDSINSYVYINPVVTGFDHDSLDYADGSGLSTVTWSFEYEAYFMQVGINAENLRDRIEAHLDHSSTETYTVAEGNANNINSGSRTPFSTGTDFSNLSVDGIV